LIPVSIAREAFFADILSLNESGASTNFIMICPLHVMN
jgi:hypothetical protein